MPELLPPVAGSHSSRTWSLFVVRGLATRYQAEGLDVTGMINETKLGLCKQSTQNT